MSESFDDDWDPFWHTEEENAAHHEAWLSWLEWQYENDPVFRARVDELNAWDDDLDDQHDQLERIAHQDPVGSVWYADRDDWIDKRLNPPK